MKLSILVLLICYAQGAVCQQEVRIRVVDKEDNNPVQASVIIKESRKGFSTDSLGRGNVFFTSNGSFTLLISASGYEAGQLKVSIPFSREEIIVELDKEEHEMEEVIVQSTRNSRSIANVPTRVETIEMEEIDEKNNMRPANVAMILHESTGIQVQQTSATSMNSSIRLQGLDGRYTQLLKDGFPNFGNFASGLSVLEIPPLDLKQVEIIKGPASPLYGAGAIAGVVNFISRTPGETGVYNFIVNQSNIGQFNVGGFASQRGKKFGYTMLALHNRSEAYDVDEDDFTEVPRARELTLHPKLFFYPGEKTTLVIGNSFTRGERQGGDVQVIKGGVNGIHQYLEENNTTRNITTLELESSLPGNRKLVGKQSYSVFDRSISIPGYQFIGQDANAYTDISYITRGGKHDLVLGGNLLFNQFREKGNSPARDNRMFSGGLYAQHTWDASEAVKLESGLRLEGVKYSNELFSNSELFALPRVSLLVRYNSRWSSRIGGGMGYKIPTLFTEETETIQYQGVDQLDNVISEKSYGGTADINFRSHISEDLEFSFNHMFFYTWITDPLVLENYSTGRYRFFNSSSGVRSAGFETNARFIFRENFKLFLGYTFTDARALYLSGKQFLPLVPRGKLNSALIYEKHDVIKLGLEGYFTGRQYLSDGSRTPAFSELGFMAEKIFEKFSLYINFENFTDTRQSRYKRVVNGTHQNPSFDEIWTHTEGFVFNGGVKLRL